MEIFFLVLLALMIFFWLVKKESQKVEKQNLEHIRFLYEKQNQMIGFFGVCSFKNLSQVHTNLLGS